MAAFSGAYAAGAGAGGSTHPRPLGGCRGGPGAGAGWSPAAPGGDTRGGPLGPRTAWGPGRPPEARSVRPGGAESAFLSGCRQGLSPCACCVFAGPRLARGCGNTAAASLQQLREHLFDVAVARPPFSAPACRGLGSYKPQGVGRGRLLQTMLPLHFFQALPELKVQGTDLVIS